MDYARWDISVFFLFKNCSICYSCSYKTFNVAQNLRSVHAGPRDIGLLFGLPSFSNIGWIPERNLDYIPTYCWVATLKWVDYVSSIRWLNAFVCLIIWWPIDYQLTFKLMIICYTLISLKWLYTVMFCLLSIWYRWYGMYDMRGWTNNWLFFEESLSGVGGTQTATFKY